MPLAHSQALSRCSGITSPLIFPSQSTTALPSSSSFVIQPRQPAGFLTSCPVLNSCLDFGADAAGFLLADRLDVLAGSALAVAIGSAGGNSSLSAASVMTRRSHSDGLSSDRMASSTDWGSFTQSGLLASGSLPSLGIAFKFSRLLGLSIKSRLLSLQSSVITRIP